jgi:anti-anti-sigma factor
VAAPLHIRQIDTPEQTVFFLQGELTGIEAVRLTARIEALEESAVKRVIMDLSLISFIDSTALGSILYCCKILKKRGRALILAAPEEHARMLFRGFPLGGVLTIVDPAVAPPRLS